MNNSAILKLASGYRGRANRCIRVAKERVEKALQYAYRDRRNKKREFRRLYIQQINAGVRQYNMSYASFMHGLVRSNVALNRKMISALAVYEPYSFRALTKVAQKHLTAKQLGNAI